MLEVLNTLLIFRFELSGFPLFSQVFIKRTNESLFPFLIMILFFDGNVIGESGVTQDKQIIFQISLKHNV
jgi:hypothetical protein